MQTRPGAASLDQIKYEVGHISGNLRWVHFQCNAFRGDWGDEALYEAAKAIAAAMSATARHRAPMWLARHLGPVPRGVEA
jgi:hypothetical protein